MKWILIVLFIISCGKHTNKLKPPPNSNSVPPTVESTPPFPHIVDSEWLLSSNIDGEKIFFEWDKDPNVYLFERENCSYCQFEMYPEDLVTSDDNKYYAWDFENSKWFDRKYYTLQKTFPYTVTWDFQDFPGYAVDTYQVFFYGNRGYSYFHNVGIVNNYTFNHLDPTKLPWTFTVYALMHGPDDLTPNRQIEIKKIVITEE